MTAAKTDAGRAAGTGERETRALAAAPELRFAQDGGAERTATGYAVLYNVEADIGGYWTEVIAPGAFDASLRQRDVIALHSHDAARIVGRVKAGTLSLTSDAMGLAFENALPDTSDGRDLAVQIERGDLAGMSFGFRTVRQEWDESIDPPKRTVLEAELYEITYTAIPAWPDTEVGLRSLEGARAERRERNRGAASSRIARRMRLRHLERNI